MSLKGLFSKVGVTKTVANQTAAEIGDQVESARYHSADIADEARFVPRINYAKPENFAKYGSAERYYEDSYTYVYSSYPYDGSLYEQLAWKNSGSYLDSYLFENQYPRTNGYIRMSYGGWDPSGPGTAPTAANNYYGKPLPADEEYVSLKGGPGQGGGPHAQSANIWQPANNRKSNLQLDLTEGATVEFWLKKQAFNTIDTHKEVVFDLWNNQQTSSAAYGRLRVELTGAAYSQPTWLVTVMSGTTGVQWQSIGSTTTASVADNKWHHYAFSFLSASSGISTKYYIDGTMETSASLGTAGINVVDGAMEAYIGALRTTVSGNTYFGLDMTGSGKLSASLDEFRYWKTQRSSKDIGRYWFTQVGGGTNTDVANTDLGVYYKFNEGITGVASTDAIVLDYSGRVTNGTWTGYAAGARSTDSAIVESSASFKEFKDPIIYSFHPLVQSTLASLKLSGSAHDYENPSMMLSFFPSWIQETDAVEGSELGKLTQILASYFDSLYLQIESINSVHDVQYVSGSTKSNTLAPRLLEARGLMAPELFLDADVLEQLADRSEDRLFRKSLSDIKNTIYQNIYNNLLSIFKTKGTKHSFRNLLRCFGVDDEIYRLNVYGNNIEYEVRNNRDLDSVKKRYIDFNNVDRFAGTVFQQTASTSNTAGYLSGSLSLTGGYASTLEAYVYFPEKPEVYDKGYSNSQYDYVSSSLFGQHTTIRYQDSDPTNLTWASPDRANFQVYAVRDEMYSRDVKFVLTTSVGSSIPDLASSYYSDVYSNTNWVFGVTIKPQKYPLETALGGPLSPPLYIVEFKGTNVEAGVELNSFLVTGTIDPAQVTYGFMTGSRRVYVGSHRTNFTGAVLTRTDVRAGFCRYWLDDITPSDLALHGMDIQSYGTKYPSLSPYLHQEDLRGQNIQFKQPDTLALNWDFETVSSSNALGQFGVPDFSSGSSVSQASRYGRLGNLLGGSHFGHGFGFPASSAEVVDANYVLAAELQNFELISSNDMISILDIVDDVQFTRQSRPIDYKFAIEKSMYRNISENMIKIFSVINDFNNIVGDPVNKYRSQYKELRVLRNRFFERVGNVPDLDKYIEFYKWFDSSLSALLQQLMPASADFSKDIKTLVESHMLERNKYQHRFPTIDLYPAEFKGTIVSPLPLSPGWQFTHHPVNDQENTNANWWKTMAARNKGKLATGISDVDVDREKVFKRTTSSDRRRKGRNIYRFNTDLAAGGIATTQRQPIVQPAGTNFHPSKQVNYVFKATQPYGPTLVASNIPRNVMIAWSGNVNQLQDIKDVINPNAKPRLSFGISPTLNKADQEPQQEYDGNMVAPFSLYSSSITTGYNSSVVTQFMSGVMITNLHEDLVQSNATRPLQGPFTEKFVGGRKYRHTPLNPGTDLRTTRAEGFRIELGILNLYGPGTAGPGALGIVPPNYPFGSSPSGSAPKGFLKDLPIANRLRNVGTKRPVNISNILMTTASADIRIPGTVAHGTIGNYSKNYQVVQTAGRTINDPFFQNQSFDFALNPETLATRGRFPLDPTSTENVGGDLNYELPNRDGPNSNQTIIVNRFAAPGSYEASSRGYLDPAHEEKSVYNVLPYRNLSVLDYGTFESSSADPSLDGSEHVMQFDELDRGLRQRLMAHNAPFGYDGVYPTYPAYYKVNRNRRRQMKEGNSFVTASVYDNWYIHHPIPRSEQQYSWVTASMAPGESIFGYSVLSGGVFVESLPLITSSTDFASFYHIGLGKRYWGSPKDNAWWGVSIIQPTYVDFLGLNTIVYEPISSSANTLGYPSGIPAASGTVDGSSVRREPPVLSYINTAFNDGGVMGGSYGAYFGQVQGLNSILINRNGPYGWPSWKQIKTHDHPVRRYQRAHSTISVRTKTAYDRRILAEKGNAITQFVEPFVYSEEKPLAHRMRLTPSDGTKAFNLVLKNSYGNKIVNYANYELDNLLEANRDYDSSGLYFNRINSMIFSGTNNDPAFGGLLSNIGATYMQRVYPAAYNSFLARTRGRQHYIISNIWNNSRALRNSTNVINSQGVATTASVWPLDGHLNFSTTSSATGYDGSGELQNNYFKYRYGGWGAAIGGAFNSASVLYAARLPCGLTGAVGSTNDIPIFAGDQYYEAAAQAGKKPYKTYEEYSSLMRLVGKDYSIVPEFRISHHIYPYLEVEGGNFTTLKDITDLIDLTGSAYSTHEELPGDSLFYREYANSDFMKFFDVIDPAYDGAELVDGSKLRSTKVGLRCSALLKLLPYDGFYPAERSLQLANIFSRSYAPWMDRAIYTPLKASPPYVLPAPYDPSYRAVVEPLFGPGILFNTIKSGIAVSNVILLNTGSRPLDGVDVIELAATYHGMAMNPTSAPEGNIYYPSQFAPRSSGLATTGYYYETLPFEAIYRPRNYLGKKTIFDIAVHPSATYFDYGVQSAAHVQWTGEGSKLYELAIDNFMCETLDFFQQGLTTFASKTENYFGTVISGSEYAMTLTLRRPMRTIATGSHITSGSIYGPVITTANYVSGSDLVDYEAFDMYRRISAFGDPIGQWSGSGKARPGFSHLTPPYFVGSGSATFTFKPVYTGRPTLSEIFSNTTITYERMQNVEYTQGATKGLPMQLNQSYNLMDVAPAIVPGTTRESQQWIIQSKFETPVLNLAGVSASIMPPTASNPWFTTGDITTPDKLSGSGLWHQYGAIPLGSDFAPSTIISGPTPADARLGINSLAEIVGLSLGTPQQLGTLRQSKEVWEAVVAVPFVVGSDGRRKFYKLEDASKDVMTTLSDSMRKYVFPPRFDFIINKDMAPVAMYVFEFSSVLTQQDLADIWQNLPPAINETFVAQEAVIEHELLADQLLNKTCRPLAQDLRWMVFKVKQRAQKDYTRYVKRGLVTDLSVIPSNIGDAKYSYNWPYDFFSLVELVKLDEAIVYESEQPPGITTQIVGDVNVVIPDVLQVDVVGDTADAGSGPSPIETPELG